MKLALSKPVTIGSEVVTDLVFRDHVVSGDLRGGVSWTKIRECDHDTIMRIAGRLCGQPDVVMNALGLKDTAAIVEFVLDFFSGDQAP